MALVAKAEKRFWSYVKKTNSCWEWLGGKDKYGYGIFWLIKNVKAHRISYEIINETIPEGLQIDHLCRNRACVNPAHLEAVTPRENTLRGITLAANNAKKTHCDHGHEFTKENTYIPPMEPHKRKCKICQRYNKRQWYYNKKIINPML